MTPPLKRSLKRARRLLAPLLMSIGLGACASGSSTPTIPLRIPFAADQEGCQVESTFQIDEPYFYAFNLAYLYRDEKPSGDDDRSRVWRLVGGHRIDPKSGLWVKPGAPLTIHLTVIQLTNGLEQVVFDAEITHPKLSSWGETLNAKLTDIQLQPGRYRFVARSMKAAPELNSVRVEFRVTRAYKGK